MFRQIQLLCYGFNSYHQKYLSVVKLLHMSVFITIGLYALIRLWPILVLPQIIMFATGVIESVVGILLGFGVKAYVYTTSKLVIHNVKKWKSVQKDKEFRRIVKSWPILKVHLGSVNFIDEVTAINALDLCCNQVASLLLM